MPTSGPRVDPAPLFDMVTGFPPDDALDLTVPMPLSLAVYMTMLESTGHAAELAVLKKIYIELARETARSIRAGIDDLVAPGSRPRITHIIEQRIPGVGGLRPHIHAYVGATVRSPGDGSETPLDVDRFAAWGDAELFSEYRGRIAAVTAERVGLEWGSTTWSSCEVIRPRWLADRTAELQRDEVACRGPWPRRQILVGRDAPR